VRGQLRLGHRDPHLSRDSTAVVLDTYGGQVSLVSTRTQHADAPITVGDFPVAIAITG
jgi:hypothetical protein